MNLIFLNIYVNKIYKYYEISSIINSIAFSLFRRNGLGRFDRFDRFDRLAGLELTG